MPTSQHITYKAAYSCISMQRVAIVGRMFIVHITSYAELERMSGCVSPVVDGAVDFLLYNWWWKHIKLGCAFNIHIYLSDSKISDNI